MSGDARAAALGDWARNAVSSPRAATARACAALTR